MIKRISLSISMIFLVAAIVGGATFALFSDEATSTGNTFAAGTLEINSELTATWSTGCDNMAPGDTKEAKITLTNSGNLELRYDIIPTLTGDLFTQQDDPKTEQLDPNCAVVKIYTSAGEELIVGDTNRVLAAGASEVLTVKVILPLEAGNAYQGDEGQVDLTFSAEQTRNNPLP